MNKELRYAKGSAGKEYWFDNKGNVVHAKIDGSDYWYEYDTLGNKVYGIDSKGIEVWFDDKIRIIHRKYPDNTEFWYNDKGKIIHKKYSNGEEEWYN